MDEDDKIGELYGCPFKHGKGWGIAVYPTEQQSQEIQKLHEAACDRREYTSDYLKGRDAVSFDKNGQERLVTITDGYRYGGCYDMSGNEMVRCECESRKQEREGPSRKPLTVGGDQTVATPPARPASRYAAAAAAARAHGLPARRS